jgi:hypothetical protein
MMHVFRLLLMAKEIATEKKVRVFRSDRDFLLSIKQGRFDYDDLVNRAEILKDELSHLYQQSDLPDIPNIDNINSLLIQIRENIYGLE